MKSQKYLLSLAAALIFGATGLLAQTSGGTTSGGTTSGTTTTTTGSTDDDSGHSGKGRGKAAPHTPNEHASDVAKAIQAALQKFDATRDQFIADRKALLDKLAAATTEEEKKAVIDQLKADHQAEKDARKQLGKEIRDELKSLRQQRKNGGS